MPHRDSTMHPTLAMDKEGNKIPILSIDPDKSVSINGTANTQITGTIVRIASSVAGNIGFSDSTTAPSTLFWVPANHVEYFRIENGHYVHCTSGTHNIAVCK